jgi:hypothetical protein
MTPAQQLLHEAAEALFMEFLSNGIDMTLETATLYHLVRQSVAVEMSVLRLIEHGEVEAKLKKGKCGDDPEDYAIGLTAKGQASV